MPTCEKCSDVSRGLTPNAGVLESGHPKDAMVNNTSKDTQKQVLELADHKKEDLAVCMGCKICASVCTVNDLEQNVNPQALLSDLFLSRDITRDHPLIRYCTSCYRCSQACPWQIRIPEIIRALKESLGIETRFEKGFKKCIDIWGRVYEPFVVMMAAPDLIKGGYLKYLPRWMEYAGFHLPHRVKSLHAKGHRPSVGNRGRSTLNGDLDESGKGGA